MKVLILHSRSWQLSLFKKNVFDSSNTERGRRRRRRKETSLFRILLLLRASSHFHPFPPSPTPDSSLYRCSHKSHNAPVIITPTTVYLQPVAWRGASLSLSLSLCLPLSLLPLFFSAFLPRFLLHVPFLYFFSPSLVISFLLHLSPVTPSSLLYPAVSSLYCNSCFLLFVLSCLHPQFKNSSTKEAKLTQYHHKSTNGFFLERMAKHYNDGGQELCFFNPVHSNGSQLRQLVD